MKNIHGSGGTAGSSLHAAALSMARGASGVWLRAVCRLGLLCRGTVYLLVGYLALRLALVSHGRAGAPASSAGAVQAADVWGRVPLVLLVAGLGAYALTQLIEAVFRPAHATGTMGRWRQRAVSSWGCLLYAAFCLSTARLAVQAQPAQTAQSEQRQDIGVTAELLRTGWGRAVLILAGVLAVVAGVETGRRSVRLDFRERFTTEAIPRALAILTRALGAVGCVARAVVFVLVGVFLVKAGVLSSAKQVKGLDAVFRFGGQLRLRLLAAGRARVRPCVLRPVLPTRSPLPRPDTRPLRAAADPCPGWRLRAPDSCCAGRRETPTITDRGQRSVIPEEILVSGRRHAGVPGPTARTLTAKPAAWTDGPRPAGRASRRSLLA